MPDLSFRYFPHPKMVAEDRRLICPQCRELLDRSDIEGFMTCPFCGYTFPSTIELEDYIIEPQIDVWMREQPGFSFTQME